LTLKDQGNLKEREYGYYFHSREHSDSPGHPQLDVLLRSVPTGKHFDPEKLSITVAPKHRGTEFLKVHHPWPGQEQYRACAGRVILQDRKGKKVEAFTFGGDLRIESEEMLTACVLTSPAPILERTGTSSIPELLAEETEIIFAERRADWEPDHSTFKDRISAVDPFTLYCVCLESLKEKFVRYPPIEDELIQQFVHFLDTEIKTLHELDKWPVSLPTISEIL
jgi:hypothetical protein